MFISGAGFCRDVRWMLISAVDVNASVSAAPSVH